MSPRAPHHRARQLGTYVSVYLPDGLAAFIEEQCEAIGATVSEWIRERVLEACPPEIKSQALSIARKDPAMTDIETELAKEIELNRERVLELESRGFLPTAICSVTKLKLKVVQQILATKAPPKRGRKRPTRPNSTTAAAGMQQRQHAAAPAATRQSAK